MGRPTSASAAFAAPLWRTGHAEMHPSQHGTAVRVIGPELAAPAAIDRVIAACGALRAGELSGVARVLDLVSADNGVWLITAGPAGPSLRYMLQSAAAVSKQGAAALLSDVALGALAVQGAGWTLAGVEADCIVVDDQGHAKVLDGPLHMAAPVPGAPAPWFAEVVEQVAARWVPDGSFAAVAASARADGMSGALALLMQVLAGQTATPDARVSVRAALGRGAATTTPAPATPPGPAATMASAPAPDAAAPPAATVASARAPDAPAPPAATMASARQFPPTDLAATALGARAGSAVATRTPSADGVFRFGPGVPPPGAVAAPASVAVAAVAPAQRRRGFATLVLLVAIGILLWWLLRPGPALTVSAVHAHGPVRPLGCNSTADLRATVRTNGAPGTLTYHWVRSDGVQSGPEIERLVSGQHDAVLHLRWTVRGQGSFAGRATVTLDHPRAGAASASFRYACN